MSDTGALRQRLAAILVADAAGYSRLMAADERATVTALDAARTVFRRHIEASRGRVIDMAGDSVLAVFELATSAVSAALAIQNELNVAAQTMPPERRMLYRSGVHTGEIIEKADGAVFGYTDLAGIARGFGLVGETVRSLNDLPRLVSGLAGSEGAAVWDIPVSDKVVSPTMRRAHSGKKKKG